MSSIQTLSVIKALFTGTIKYSNTRLQPLINGGTFICAHNLHQFMQSLHPSLTIRQWLEELKVDVGETRGKTAKKLLCRVREQLDAMTVNRNRPIVLPLVVPSNVPSTLPVPHPTLPDLTPILQLRVPPPILPVPLRQHVSLCLGPIRAAPYQLYRDFKPISS